MTSFGPDNKRWAQRAREVQFSELSSVRATAEQWRNGLAGLTALLSAAALITSPTLGAKISGGWRVIVGLLVLGGLVALIYGTWRAMLAAFGVPGTAIPMTGERLQAWEQQQAGDAVDKLDQARFAFLAGVGMIVAASAVAFWVQPSSPSGPAVVITTTTEVLCGHLGSGKAGSVELRTADGQVHTVPLGTVKNIVTESTC
jgi:hypothetical protein